MVGPFHRLVTIPHILTETSNLLANEKGPRREDLYGKLAEFTQRWMKFTSKAVQ
jgi:hypothetical protein